MMLQIMDQAFCMKRLLSSAGGNASLESASAVASMVNMGADGLRRRFCCMNIW